MNIGYVCIILSVPNIKMKSCVLRNASPEHLKELIEHNLKTLDEMLEYNVRNGIHLFRISSGIIPFASHPVNTVEWNKIYKKELEELGEKAKTYKIRLSMHAGQYTLLNTPNPEFLKKSIKDLEYHAKFFDSMKLERSNKVILHVGGVYGDKNESIKRFVSEYKKLPKFIKNRLVIENDDKNYTLEDCLNINKQTGVPIVFDYFHHILNPSLEDKSLREILEIVKKTWKKEDGVLKIHYSQQAEGKSRGSHSQTIDIPPFLEFYSLLPKDVDLMLEVKDKDISAIKCIKEIKLKK